MGRHRITDRTKGIHDYVLDLNETIEKLKQHSCQDTSLETTLEMPSKEEHKKLIQNNPPYVPASELAMEDVILASGTWIKEEKPNRAGYQYRYIGNYLSNPKRKGKAWGNRLHSTKEAYHYADLKRKMQNRDASSEKTMHNTQPQGYVCAYANQTFKKREELPCVIDYNMVCPNKKCRDHINSLFR